ncbi:hypothetical protein RCMOTHERGOOSE_42 [Rhodobacter phage RcMotherGoose]|nr:hypothetical protein RCMOTHERGOOSE_42 [Rhodobacter phage RcMotherGoose]
MTLLVIGYDSKKTLKANVGKPLNYQETSMFGAEYKADGEFSVAHRPSMSSAKNNVGREFFARVTMKNGLIAKVE